MEESAEIYSGWCTVSNFISTASGLWTSTQRGDFSSTYAYDFFKRSYKYFAVTNFSGACTSHNGLQYPRDLILNGYDCQQQLGMKVDSVLASSIKRGVASLMPESDSFCNGEAFHGDVGEALAHVI